MKLQKEEHAVLLLLILSTLATGLLYVAASTSSIIPSATASPDGTICVEGTLLHKETTYKGNHITMTVKTSSGPLTVFVPATADCYDIAARAEPGCTMIVSGKEQEYKGKPEIVASALKIA